MAVQNISFRCVPASKYMHMCKALAVYNLSAACSLIVPYCLKRCTKLMLYNPLWYCELND